MQAGKNPEPRKRYKKIENFSYQIEELIKLPESKTNLNISFLEVINNRKSVRTFKKLTLEQISTLLLNSAKTKKIFISDSGSILSHRSSPSAGAIHPIDIFISLPVTLKKRTLCYYDPISHKLAKLKLSDTELMSFFEVINNCLPLGKATLIWFVAHPDRTTTKYKNSESLIWRDAGALLMTVQLVSTAFAINSCPVGTLGEPFFSKAFRNKLVSAGGLLLG